MPDLRQRVGSISSIYSSSPMVVIVCRQLGAQAPCRVFDGKIEAISSSDGIFADHRSNDGGAAWARVGAIPIRH